MGGEDETQNSKINKPLKKIRWTLAVKSNRE